MGMVSRSQLVADLKDAIKTGEHEREEIQRKQEAAELEASRQRLLGKVSYDREVDAIIDQMPAKLQSAVRLGKNRVDLFGIETGESEKYECHSVTDIATPGNLKGVAQALWRRIESLGLNPQLHHHIATGGNDKYDSFDIYVLVADLRLFISSND